MCSRGCNPGLSPPEQCGNLCLLPLGVLESLRKILSIMTGLCGLPVPLCYEISLLWRGAGFLCAELEQDMCECVHVCVSVCVCVPIPEGWLHRVLFQGGFGIIGTAMLLRNHWPQKIGFTWLLGELQTCFRHDGDCPLHEETHCMSLSASQHLHVWELHITSKAVKPDHEGRYWNKMESGSPGPARTQLDPVIGLIRYRTNTPPPGY